MATVKCYIDGFNLYHAISALEHPEMKWLNLKSVAQLMLRQGDVLVGVEYFTAVVHWNKEKAQRHTEYIKALESVGVKVTKSYFKRTDKHCMTLVRSCPFYEEKQTDVALATRVLRDALCGAAERQIVVTADADHVPLFKHIRESCPQIEIELAAPPGRLHLARELGKLATWHRELKAGQLLSCLFPRNVTDASGAIVARAPASYVVS